MPQGVPQGDIASANQTRVETQIEEIRNEGLTGRQLRMARRLAEKHNLPATSDFDAIRLLRDKGIDPFQKSNMLELVVPDDKPSAKPDAGKATGADGPEKSAEAEPKKKQAQDGQPAEKVSLPQTVPSTKQNLPSTEMSPAARRDLEIGRIQRDIVRRRRRKLMLLGARLAFFVLLPTAMVGYYFSAIATPMYETKSEFLILNAEGGAAAAAAGGLLSNPLALNQDAIAVQSYLTSKDAMLRLDSDVGFKSHFTQDWIDPIQRLKKDPSNEEAYKTYGKNVKVGYDPTEGVIRMQTIAADPEVSAAYSRELISYAEERVNLLSAQKRDDQMREALTSLEEAKAERRLAQEDLVELQLEGAILDPENVIASLRSQISTYEAQLREKELALAALEDNPRPNKAKVAGTRGDIGRLNEVLDELNSEMLDVSKGDNSLAHLQLRVQMAQADLATRDLMLQSVLQLVEDTRKEANRQVRYLTTSVNPVASQDATYPRKFENTVVAFLIFCGVYLILSLTSSILREQVTS